MIILRNVITVCLLGAPLALATLPAKAGSTSYCVSCVEPDRIYVCRVEMPGNDPGPGALQFYCIVRTAKEEGHKSCAVTNQEGGLCSGIEKRYTYNGPALPPDLQAAINRQAAPVPLAPPNAPVEPQPVPPATAAKEGPPETLVEMGARAGKAARQGLRATGSVVRNAVGTSGDAVEDAAQGSGEVARESGSRVGNAARSVGRAAKTTFGCMWSLFKDCGSDAANQP